MNQRRSAVSFSVISTGEELASGETIDTNAAYISRALDQRGYLPRRLVTIGDDAQRLTQELRRATEDSDMVVVTGGLGPTGDDRTRKAIANALDVEMAEDADVAENVRSLTREHGREAKPHDLSQASFPKGSHVFQNPNGTAPGFACELESCWILALPGVPTEMKAMLSETALPFLEERLGANGHVVTRMVNIFGVPESRVDSTVSDLTEEGRNPTVAPTARGGVIRLCVRARAADRSRAEQLADKDVQTIRQRFGNRIFGEDEATLASTVKSMLEEENLTISAAESCTGGLIGDMLTDVSGVSAVLLADVVAYSNEAKTDILGVPREQIVEHGAVSAPVAESMARGVCEVTGADVGVSTTGIAGPTGGTPEKPVGLVYVGLCVSGRVSSKKLNLWGNRRNVKDRSAKHALNAVRLALLTADEDK